MEPRAYWVRTLNICAAAVLNDLGPNQVVDPATRTECTRTKKCVWGPISSIVLVEPTCKPLKRDGTNCSALADDFRTFLLVERRVRRGTDWYR
jgi:hypothetical protein